MKQEDYIITDYTKFKAYQNELAALRAAEVNWTAKRRKNRRAKLKRRWEKRVQRNREVLGKNPIRDYYLYALLLENNNYYVGVTSHKDAIKRYEQHCNGKGSKWTQLHKPVQILEVRHIGKMQQSYACEQEDRLTLEYIDKYGIEKVRGGKLCMVKLETVKLHFNQFSPVTITKPAVRPVYIPDHIRAIMNEE